MVHAFTLITQEAEERGILSSKPAGIIQQDSASKDDSNVIIEDTNDGPQGIRRPLQLLLQQILSNFHHPNNLANISTNSTSHHQPQLQAMTNPLGAFVALPSLDMSYERNHGLCGLS